MGSYLLDTHAAIWFFNDDKSLSEAARLIISDLSNTMYLSIASIWEFTIKSGLGRAGFGGNTANFARLAQANKITVIPINVSHLTVLEKLPPIHRDPFDRLLIASAVAEEMTLITTDKDIALYDVPNVW